MDCDGSDEERLDLFAKISFVIMEESFEKNNLLFGNDKKTYNKREERLFMMENS